MFPIEHVKETSNDVVESSHHQTRPSRPESCRDEAGRDIARLRRCMGDEEGGMSAIAVTAKQ